MKIAVTGKGGVGKTTVSAVLARLYAEEGKKVFAVDVDPDANLGLALGFPEEMLESMIPISKMRKMIEERTGADKSNTFYKVNPKVDDIPETYGKEYNGVRLLLLGTVETAGGGCVCPENVMLRRIINNLVLHRDDIVILDMEGRGKCFYKEVRIFAYREHRNTNDNRSINPAPFAAVLIPQGGDIAYCNYGKQQDEKSDIPVAVKNNIGRQKKSVLPPEIRGCLHAYGCGDKKQ